MPWKDPFRPLIYSLFWINLKWWILLSLDPTLIMEAFHRPLVCHLSSKVICPCVDGPNNIGRNHMLKGHTSTTWFTYAFMMLFSLTWNLFVLSYSLYVLTWPYARNTGRSGSGKNKKSWFFLLGLKYTLRTCFESKKFLSKSCPELSNQVLSFSACQI